VADSAGEAMRSRSAWALTGSVPFIGSSTASLRPTSTKSAPSSTTTAQADAVVKLLPSLEDFFAISNVIEVKRVPVSVTRQGDRIRFSVPNTTVDIELMRGAGGLPIRTEGLPHADFGKAPPYLEHTQYRTVALKHQGGEQRFDYSGTNAFAARIDDAGRI